MSRTWRSSREQYWPTIYDRWGTRLLEQNVRVFLQAPWQGQQGDQGDH